MHRTLTLKFGDSMPSSWHTEISAHKLLFDTASTVRTLVSLPFGVRIFTKYLFMITSVIWACLASSPQAHGAWAAGWRIFRAMAFTLCDWD